MGIFRSEVEKAGEGVEEVERELLEYIIERKEELFSMEGEGVKFREVGGKGKQVIVIKSCSMEGLIVNLLDPYSSDRDLVDVVLLTHHYFVNSLKFFGLLGGFYDPRTEKKWRIQVKRGFWFFFFFFF